MIILDGTGGKWLGTAMRGRCIPVLTVLCGYVNGVSSYTTLS